MRSMKPGAVLINTARGGLIDHAALVDALGSNHLAGFGADVLDIEPPEAGHPLLSLPNVIITPHSASLTRSTYREICVRSVSNVLAVLGGEAPEPGCVFNAAAFGVRA
jgi:D-3-phosphoglycerate dehydrogenase